MHSGIHRQNIIKGLAATAFSYAVVQGIEIQVCICSYYFGQVVGYVHGGGMIVRDDALDGGVMYST